MQLNWTDLADVDLENIEAHITQDNSPIIAIDVVMDIIDSTYLILSEHPRAGRLGRVKGTRELAIDGLPFIAIYREPLTVNRVEILCVLHETQQWRVAD